jgi:transcriptional regulator NrdR family protein
MKKLINAIAEAVTKRILSEDQVDQFVDRIVELLIERLQNEFGDS